MARQLSTGQARRAGLMQSSRAGACRPTAHVGKHRTVAKRQVVRRGRAFRRHAHATLQLRRCRVAKECAATGHQSLQKDSAPASGPETQSRFALRAADPASCCPRQVALARRSECSLPPLPSSATNQERQAPSATCPSRTRRRDQRTHLSQSRNRYPQRLSSHRSECSVCR